MPDPILDAIDNAVRDYGISDGEEITYTMQGAEQVTVSMDWEQPDLDPWDMFDTPPFVRSRRMESFTLTVGYPQDLRQTHRAG